MSVSVKIASGTLNNGAVFPLDANGRPKLIRDILGASPEVHNATCFLQIGAGAAFGTATITAAYSLNGVDWITIGSAIAAAGVTNLGLLPLAAFFRISITGSGNITTADVWLA